MYIENHLLKGTFAGRSAKQLHCNKKSGLLEYPDMIVLHYTAGGNAMSSAHYLARADTDASAHLVIARDGGIIQLLPFDTIAWHAGQSEYAGRTNLNRYSIGIEMDNAGELHRREGKFYSWFNREYMPDEVYTVCRLLLKAYPIHYIVGHSEITNRKLDPGAAFPLKQFREQLLKINNP